MGIFDSPSTVASNSIDSAIVSSISILNSVNQNCQLDASNKIDVDIESCGGNININNMNISQDSKVATACKSSANMSNKAKQDIQNTFAQQAKAFYTGLGIGGGDVEASNSVASFVELSTQVTNMFEQDCNTNVNNQMNVFVSSCPQPGKTGPGGKIDINGLYMGQSLKATANCVQNAVAKNDLTISIKQSIKQTATATQVGMMGMVLILICIAIIIIGAVAGGPLMKLLMVLAILLFLAAGIYLIIAYTQKWFPFSVKKTKKRPIPQKDWFKIPEQLNFNSRQKHLICRSAKAYICGMSPSSGQSSWEIFRETVFSHVPETYTAMQVALKMCHANPICSISGICPSVDPNWASQNPTKEEIQARKTCGTPQCLLDSGVEGTEQCTEWMVCNRNEDPFYQVSFPNSSVSNPPKSSKFGREISCSSVGKQFQPKPNGKGCTVPEDYAISACNSLNECWGYAVNYDNDWQEKFAGRAQLFNGEPTETKGQWASYIKPIHSKIKNPSYHKEKPKQCNKY